METIFMKIRRKKNLSNREFSQELITMGRAILGTVV
jgi:hypothetical protein